MTAGSGAKVLLVYADAATQQAVLPAAMFTDRALAEVRKRWAQSAAEREPGVASVWRRCATAAVRWSPQCGVRADRPNGTPPGRTLGRRLVGGRGCIDAPALTAEQTLRPTFRHEIGGFRLLTQEICSPDGIRTYATAVRGRRPRPLDDGAGPFVAPRRAGVTA